MKLFVIVVLILAYFPALLDSSMSGRAALDTNQMHPASAFMPSDALNTGSARVEVPATVYPAHPNNRGFFDSVVSISTAVHVTSNQSVATIAKAASHLNPAQLRTHYVQILEWLQIQLICFVGGVITVCQYLLFLALGLALIQKHIIRGLALHPELVVVPVLVGPAGPVVECRVPNTQAPVPPANPPRRPMVECRVPNAQAPVPPANPPRRPLVRRPLLNPTIARRGGLQQNTAPAPQPVAPVQPPRPGSWIEEMSAEGKLVFYSHSTGPGGSLEYTAQYFPRREYWYYISQYPANPNLDPLMDLLFGFRPFIIKVPGEIMEEVRDYLFSKSVDKPEVDITSVPLPPSRPESPEGPTQIDMIEVPIAVFTSVRADSGSEAFVASAPSDTANADTNRIGANFVRLPLPTPPPHKANSTCKLQTQHANPTPTLPRPLSQWPYSIGRVSIATPQIARLYVTCSTVPEPLPPPQQAAAIRLNIQPQLAGLATRAELRHPPQHRAGSGAELEKDDRAEANINEVANPRKRAASQGRTISCRRRSSSIAVEGRGLLQGRIGNGSRTRTREIPRLVLPPQAETLFAPVPSSASNAYQPLSSTAIKNSA
ncbi:hypothetical protein M407DRAFT_27494 [Tulasnella calospora MUT 4182]|uniref:Uncharacterized protein n=1 Tax=Tulasnella calospora MUT 4182 TaxID=1051891 RepID=A0A0C3Q302_9AGAM|nr:hypothetical protein M407DRAFT_27494 [Tulasnella calospora MUT 4182]